MQKDAVNLSTPAKSNRTSPQVKMGTLYLTGLVCLVLGFIAGTVLTVYKLDQTQPPPKSMSPTDAQDHAKDEARIKALEQEVAQNPSNLNAWIELGNLYFDASQFSQSIEAYQKALALDANNADVWTDLGVMYRRNGQPQKAIEAFDKAIQVDPSHEISRFNKGIVLLHDLNDPQGAIKAWESMLAINPNAMAPNGQPVKSLVEMFKQRLKAQKQP